MASNSGHFASTATPAPIVETLRRAVRDGIEDPEARKVVGGILRTDYVFVDGPSSQRIVERLRTDYTSDPRIEQRLKQIMDGKK